MGRWIAVGRKPAWSTFEAFRDDLKANDKWRLDAKTSISSAIVLQDGRVLVECQAAEQAAFDDWLKARDIEVESLSELSHIALNGNVWSLKKA